MRTVVEAIGLSCCKNRAARPNSAVLTEHARIDGNVVGSSELTMKHIQRCCISNSIRARCLQSKILVARYRAGRQFEQSAQRLLKPVSRQQHVTSRQ